MKAASVLQEDVKPRPAHRSLSVRPEALSEVQRECRRLGVKQNDFLSVLLRAWKSIPPTDQLAFIPNEPVAV